MHHFVNKHAHRIFSSSILRVMTSTDNIIDVVVMCICVIICQQVNPPNKMSKSAPAKAAKYIIGIYSLGLILWSLLK